MLSIKTDANFTGQFWHFFQFTLMSNFQKSFWIDDKFNSRWFERLDFGWKMGFGISIEMFVFERKTWRPKNGVLTRIFASLCTMTIWCHVLLHYIVLYALSQWVDIISEIVLFRCIVFFYKIIFNCNFICRLMPCPFYRTQELQSKTFLDWSKTFCT